MSRSGPKCKKPPDRRREGVEKIVKLLTRDAVNETFDREKVLLGTKSDGVPEERVAELFGWDAVKKVRDESQIPGFDWDSFGGMVCFYRSGFLKAAIYYNAAQFRQSGEK